MKPASFHAQLIIRSDAYRARFLCPQLRSFPLPLQAARHSRSAMNERHLRSDIPSVPCKAHPYRHRSHLSPGHMMLSIQKIAIAICPEFSKSGRKLRNCHALYQSVMLLAVILKCLDRGEFELPFSAAEIPVVVST